MPASGYRGVDAIRRRPAALEVRRLRAKSSVPSPIWSNSSRITKSASTEAI